jgi:hypothetical protein
MMRALAYNIQFMFARWSALEADRRETRRQDRKVMGIIRAFEAQQRSR